MAEGVEDIVVVGAGIAGLATALGLHRMGMKSLILESSDRLRSSGFALTLWGNAWRALDVLGVADSLRRQHVRLQGITISSTSSGDVTSQTTFESQAASSGNRTEMRCVRRNLLLEALAGGLPEGGIRFCSKVVLIEERGNLKLVHLADGSVVRCKVLIGCDGVNSAVAKWLGLGKPAYSGRSASRGIAEFPGGHGFEPLFLQCVGDGFRSGFMPCDDRHVYWFFTYSAASPEVNGLEDDMVKMKQYVLSKLGRAPEGVVQAVERTEPLAVVSSPLRLRWPFGLLIGGICRENVCLAGDALHAMTPDLGQGGCSALEDGVTLARCLGEAFLRNPGGGDGEEHDRIKAGLEKYAGQRRWRSFRLICTAYVMGWIQQGSGAVMNFLRDRWLASAMTGMLLKMADFDCGDLSAPA